MAAYGAGLVYVVCIVVGLNVPVPSGWNVVVGGKQRRRFRATSAVGYDFDRTKAAAKAAVVPWLAPGAGVGPGIRSLY